MALNLGNSSKVCWLVVYGATATGDNGTEFLRSSVQVFISSGGVSGFIHLSSLGPCGGLAAAF